MAITKSTAKKILQEEGAQRVSDSAAMEFSRIINKYAYSIAKKAVKLAAHARRKTVEKSDIELAK
ncbi:MAG: histone [Candidatus Micrarchaeia archaeon]